MEQSDNGTPSKIKESVPKSVDGVCGSLLLHVWSRTTPSTPLSSLMLGLASLPVYTCKFMCVDNLRSKC